LLHGYKQQYDAHYHSPSDQAQRAGLWVKLKEWFKGNF
jgi:hypothetical protein